ncbi:hypothetical protein [Sphingomonas bacterium]|uniref:hypothetical protein n=1 Tax=Sphingomonas bacterium TaxID=1895847 RepID=UPI0026107F1E|nr:hypothetical protein [Sphingomonas bacterium]
MNVQVKGKVFKSGNSVAVRLPKGYGFKAGEDITPGEERIQGHDRARNRAGRGAGEQPSAGR